MATILILYSNIKCYVLNYVTLKKNVLEFQSSVPEECNLIWRLDFYSGYYIKTRSLGRTLVQYDWCFSEEGKSEHRCASGKVKGRDREETAVYKPRRGARAVLPSQLSERDYPWWPHELEHLSSKP